MRRFGVGKATHLVSIGDSLTAERSFAAANGGAYNFQTYPALLAKAKGYGSFYNAGVSGNTTAQMAARFDAEVLAHRAGAISIMGFTNDQTTNISGGVWTGAGMTLAETKKNLKAMVMKGMAAGARVTLLSPPPQRVEPYLSHSADYLTTLAAIASETGCEYMDVYTRINGLTSGQQDALYITNDLTGHISYVGHQYIADMAAEVANVNCFALYNGTLPPAATISGVSPSSGTTAGGTSVTISGSHLCAASAATFGGTNVASVTVSSDTSISVSTPAHAAGLVDVVVRNPRGLTTSSNAYTYTNPPGSSTFDSGSGNFSVPAYTTLTVEVWGGGGSGSPVATGLGAIDGNAGGASSCSTLSMTANGGGAGKGTGAASSGGTASGGNTTNGTGTNGTVSGGVSTGGGANTGGGNVTLSSGGSVNPGTNGSTPGGGGTSNIDTANASGGGAGGGYSKSVYTFGVTPGAPSVGASLAYSVGAGGAATTLNGRTSGAGTNGRVKFTWS